MKPLMLSRVALRASAASSSASKRSTSTGVVLEARSRPQPSFQSARRPSMVVRRAPANGASSTWAAAAKRATIACGLSSTGTLISGVETLSGSSSSTSLGVS